MTWTCEYEDRLFTVSDKGMIDSLVEHYYDNDLAVGEAFAEWVNETYTPWDALNCELEWALSVWAEHVVTNRQDIVEALLPWAHCEEVKE